MSPVGPGTQDREDWKRGRGDGRTGRGFLTGQSIWYLMGWEIGDLQNDLYRHIRQCTEIRTPEHPVMTRSIERPEDI